MKQIFFTSLALLLLAFHIHVHAAPKVNDAKATDDNVIYQDYLHRDIRDDIFYFVLPDRFNNGNQTNDNGAVSGVSHGGFDPRSERGFHGGDINGIEQKLAYLESLGITAIWMTPLLRNNAIQKDGIAHHGYWIVDFTEIDPHFGTNDDLKQLIDAAHRRGMKVFFDIITNHTADIIRYKECHQLDGRFIEGLTRCEYKPVNTAMSEQYSPFLLDDEANIKTPSWLNDPQYYHNQGDSNFEGESSLNGDFNGLDDLNTLHPKVLSGMVEIYQNLIAEFKPDGFRIDTVRHVDLSFWQTFSPAIVEFAKQQGIPQFHVFGEVYDTNPVNLSLYTTDGKLPSVLDFAFQDVAAKIFYQGQSPLLAKQLFEQDDLYKDEDSQADLLMTFLSNHDMGRAGYFINDAGIASTEAEKLQRSILSHAFMFLSRGIPVVYYGDEQGFTGDGNDIDAREDMFASHVASYNDNSLLGTLATTADDNFNIAHPLYRAIAALSELRKTERVLRRGEYQARFYADKENASHAAMFAFSRIDSSTGEELLMVFNTGTSLASATIPMLVTEVDSLLNTQALKEAATSSKTAISPSQVRVNEHDIKVSLAGLSFEVYRVTHRNDY